MEARHPQGATSPEPTAATMASAAAIAFAELVDALALGDGAVERPQPTRRAFGSNGIKVHGKIFAMLVRDALVLKLPRARVDGLIAEGTGATFDAGKGKPTREWVTVVGARARWLALAREARAFAEASKGR